MTKDICKQNFECDEVHKELITDTRKNKKLKAGVNISIDEDMISNTINVDPPLGGLASYDKIIPSLLDSTNTPANGTVPLYRDNKFEWSFSSGVSDNRWQNSKLNSVIDVNGKYFIIQFMRGDNTIVQTNPVNLKTIDNQSIFGDGNIELPTGDTSWKESIINATASDTDNTLSITLDRGDGGRSISPIIKYSTVDGQSIIGNKNIVVDKAWKTSSFSLANPITEPKTGFRTTFFRGDGSNVDFTSFYKTINKQVIPISYNDPNDNINIPVGPTFYKLKMNGNGISANYPDTNPVFTVSFTVVDKMINLTMSDIYPDNTEVNFSDKSTNVHDIQLWLNENQLTSPIGVVDEFKYYYKTLTILGTYDIYDIIIKANATRVDSFYVVDHRGK